MNVYYKLLSIGCLYVFTGLGMVHGQQPNVKPEPNRPGRSVWLNKATQRIDLGAVSAPNTASYGQAG